VNTINDIQYSEMVDGEFENNPEKSNHFLYGENINAAYINWNKEFKKVTLQIGLRGEQYNATGKDIIGEPLVHRSNFNLFPSGFIQYNINEKNQLSFSYSSRINRPVYYLLNPFEYYYDPYTYQLGNPYLLPELARVFDLSYLFMGKYFLSYNASVFKDYNYEASIQNDSLKTLAYMPVNLAKALVHSLSLAVPLSLAKWWDLNGNFAFTYSIYKGTLNEIKLDNSMASFNFNLANSFILPRHYTVSLFGFYQAPSLSGIQKFDQVSNVSVSLKKSIWNDKANIIASAKDIFKGQRDNVTVDFDNLHLKSRQVYDSRRGSLTFTYNFNKGKHFKTRNINSANEEERSRVKQ